MRVKKLMKLIAYSFLGLLLMAVVGSACASPAPTPTPATKPTPAATPTPSTTSKPGPASPSAAEFYKDKTITWNIALAPGNEPDLVARIVAPTLQKSLSAAAVKVENKTGGGGIEAWNNTWNAQPDGLTLATADPGFPLLNIFEEAGALFKADKFTYLGATPPRPILLDVSSQKYNSFGDLKGRKNLVFGGGAPSGRFSIMLISIILAFDLDGKVVVGLKTSDRTKAIAQGDMDGSLYSEISTIQEQAGLKSLKPVLIIGSERLEGFPGVPTLRELAKDLPSEKVALARIAENLMSTGDPTFMTPGVPKDRADFFAQALDKAMMQNQAEIEKVGRYSLTKRLSGQQTQAVVLDMLKPENQAKYKQLFQDLRDKYIIR